MAEPIGLASGVLTLATFAFQSSVALINTVQSFHNHPIRVRDLKGELEALSVVLSSLAETIASTTDVDFSVLKLPLQRCGSACKEFEREIVKCSSRSTDSRTSFRDWAKLRYMGGDIDYFRQLLSGYKSTIVVALTDANLRKASITAESLDTYKSLIKNATDDLEAHLQNIDEKLETIFGHTTTGSGSDALEMRLIQEERLSTQKCLQICAQLSEHIDQITLSSERSDPSAHANLDTIPKTITINGLQECKNSLILTAAKLERHMKDIMDRMVAKSRAAITSEEELADLARLRDEWTTTRQCVNICSQAEIHLKENTSTIDNYATGDAIQFMVSTDGKTIHGKNRGLGWRSRQVGGHLSDLTVQKISQDFSTISFQSVERARPSPRENAPSGRDGAPDDEPASEFKERYGPGFKLPSTANISAESRPGLKKG
ncbi:MAG: hypothetical protein M1829_000196 [Trizodia sp. TS-e1964]|nr:MAG: hypothetical protein M1829_000196 [Trizodia sp. TS-e1964]